MNNNYRNLGKFIINNFQTKTNLTVLSVSVIDTQYKHNHHVHNDDQIRNGDNHDINKEQEKKEDNNSNMWIFMIVIILVSCIILCSILVICIIKRSNLIYSKYKHSQALIEIEEIYNADDGMKDNYEK